jgi:hypothetical protein
VVGIFKGRVGSFGLVLFRSTRSCALLGGSRVRTFSWSRSNLGVLHVWDYKWEFVKHWCVSRVSCVTGFSGNSWRFGWFRGSGESGLVFSDLVLFGLIMSSSDSFGVRFTSKNYSVWEFQFRLFVMGKELWGQIDGSDPEPKELTKWKVNDACVMS